MRAMWYFLVTLSLVHIRAFSVSETISSEKFGSELIGKSACLCDEERTCDFRGETGQRGLQGKPTEIPSNPGTMTVTFSNFSVFIPGTIFSLHVVDPVGNKYSSDPIDDSALPTSIAINIGPQLYSGLYVIYSQYISGNTIGNVGFTYHSSNSNNLDNFIGRGSIDFANSATIGPGNDLIFGGVISNP